MMAFAQYDTLRISGIFMGKDLLRNSPFSKSGKFCIVKELVNGKEINSSENPVIDLHQLGLKSGDSAKIEIIHLKSCVPVVLNEHEFLPVSTCTYQNMKFKGDSLFWETINEKTKNVFQIQQMSCGSWKTVKTIPGTGNNRHSAYSALITLLSGENSVRIIQQGFDKEPNMSEVITVFSEKEPVKLQSVKGVLDFSESVNYIIHDQYGNLKIAANGVAVDLKDYKNDIYFLCFDNQKIKFRKSGARAVILKD